MALAKQTTAINFAQGLDRKTDPFQVPFGNFLSLINMVFTTGKRLTKRNGFGNLPALPTLSSFLTTLSGDLTALGSKIQAYSSEFEKWTTVGNFYPCNLSTLAVVRTNTNQSQCDSVIAPNGLLCMAWTDQTPTSLATPQYKFAVYDSSTGQQLLAPQVISDADPTYGAPRAFIVGNYFVIGYTAKISSVNSLRVIPISLSALTIGSEIVISTSVTPAAGVAWDAAVLNNSLYFAWNGASTSGLKMASLSATLAVSSAINPDDSNVSTQVTVCTDATAGVIYATYYNKNLNTGYTVAVNAALAVLPSFPVESISSTAQACENVESCVATAGTLTIFLEVANQYSYDDAIGSNFIASVTVTQAAAVGSITTLARSVGLASKAFVVGGTPYVLSVYVSPYQPTYFLLNGVTGEQVAQLAYENGSDPAAGLPSVSVNGNEASVAYLYKDFIQALSDANAAGTAVVGGIYTQTGINQATFTLGTSASLTSVEMASNLNITGGFLWSYDGTQAVEQGFFLYPDSVEVAASETSGSMTAQQYFYQAIYSWSDNRGNIYRSAGSIPVSITLGDGDTAVTVQGPMLRLTYKTDVKIEIFRYSAGQESWFEVTSIATPLLNDPTADSWTFTDTQADSAILGNQLLYTTGGVLEDIGGPSFVNLFTFDDRLWGILSEDPNTLWFSKQVIEGTPVELSDLLTQYVAPGISAQGPTGPLTCGFPMDDKAILFKDTALYYINGTGPENTGANSSYSQPTFITSMIGCSNPASIVFQPAGLMFEFASESGNQIWLLGRDLSTQYIGAAVEDLTRAASVTSAVAIPGTNQVRFSLSSGITIVYDYFYGQWAQFTTSAISSTLFENLHTYINAAGSVFQETPGAYLDGTKPVLMSFTTAWLNLMGLQGYQRAYWFYFMGTYLSPHKIQLGIAYDYESTPLQYPLITPRNYAPTYGADSPYGQGSPYGGPGSLEQWKVFFVKQRCQAFQIQFQELYDPSFGVPAGAGLTLSGLNLVYGQKKGYVPLPYYQETS